MPPSKQKADDVAARRARLVQLRAAGMSFADIASNLSYSSRAAAAVDLKRALADEREDLSEEAPHALVLELTRLDTWQRAAETVLGRARSAGEDTVMLRAIDRLLLISKRRVLLLGLEHGVSAPQPQHPADELRARRLQRQRRGAAPGT